jgi:quinoprotein dehydrogenase-associated probable ABC transporter substrate-binding protein
MRNSGMKKWLLALLAVGMMAPAWADDIDTLPYALRVCQDPSNMPFSNEAGEGYTNRIAQVVAQKMGIPLEYFSFPQRLGYFRNTLKFKVPGDSYYRCDVDLNSPVESGEVTTTKPYYRSSWVLVYVNGKGLDDVKTEEDLARVKPEVMESIHIAVGDRSPGSQWLLRHDLLKNGVPLQMMRADPGYYPGEVIEKGLAQGKYEAAIVWGPVAGYYMNRVSSPAMTMVPLKSMPGVSLQYSFGFGVRFGEPKWKAQLQKALDASQPEITAILREYHVPLVDESGNLIP